MGLFDTIVNNGFKLKVPREVSSFLKANNAEIPDEFQTKDLDNCLTTFKLYPNGRLLELTRKPTGRKIKYKNPFEGWKDNRPLLEKIYHKLFVESKFTKIDMVDETIDIYVKSDLTATFEMYSYEEIGGRYLTLDYTAEAVKGVVKKAKLLKWEIEDEQEAKERIQRDKEWKQKADESLAKSRDLKSKWYYPLIKEIYNPIIFFSGLAIRGVCGWLSSKTYTWRRY